MYLVDDAQPFDYSALTKETNAFFFVVRVGVRRLVDNICCGNDMIFTIKMATALHETKWKKCFGQFKMRSLSPFSVHLHFERFSEKRPRLSHLSVVHIQIAHSTEHTAYCVYDVVDHIRHKLLHLGLKLNVISKGDFV